MSCSSIPNKRDVKEGNLHKMDVTKSASEMNRDLALDKERGPLLNAVAAFDFGRNGLPVHLLWSVDIPRWKMSESVRGWVQGEFS
jgi:hypothetical protein